MVNTARFSRNLFVVGEDDIATFARSLLEITQYISLFMEYRVDCKIIFCSLPLRQSTTTRTFCFMSALLVQLVST